MSSAVKDQVQPAVSADATSEEQGTICIIGRRYKTATAVAVMSVLVTLVIAGFTMVWAGGVNANRVTVLEERSGTAHTIQETIRTAIGNLKTQQAVTQTTVENIEKQQTADRLHFDERMNRLFKAVRRRPQ